MVKAPLVVTAKENWFCDMGAEHQTWECVKDYTPDVSKKRPVDSPSSVNRSLPRTSKSIAQQNADEVAIHAPELNTELPLYRRLAYNPGQSVNLIDLPPDYFTVQLFAVSSKAALEKFVREKNIPGLSATRIAHRDQLFFVLLLGIYADENTARTAAANLPVALTNLTPWVRRLGSLQDAMLRGDDIAGTSAI
ncbi:MAG: SPOR domain-containing protein [Pseudomonadales bacterium]|nr:SPOR domain-containing protein [Pseudomonadales bacterium]